MIAAVIFQPYTRAFGSVWMVCALIVANCFFSQVTTLGSSVAFAVGQPRLSAAIAVASNGVRLLVLCILKVCIDHANAFQWSLCLLVASGLAALVVYSTLHRAIGPAKIELGLLKRRFVEGLGFSVAGTTEAVNNDLDKIMLVHYGMTVQNGFYTLAYRVVDFATSPIIALNSAVMQKHFVLNASGPGTVAHLLKKSLMVSVSFGILAAFAMRIGAPLLPLVAGKSYAGAIAALKILCWLPVIRGIHQMCGSAVTGLGHQGWRTAAQATAAVLNVGLNALLIPSYGWRGAAWSTLASDSLIAVLNVTIFVVAFRLLGRNKQNLEPEAA
jgi:O-antigen/teichoic acid export membrane protein